MPKLLQINVTANWGSTGKIAEQIGQRAMQEGWESYIAYGRMMNPSHSKLIKIGTKADVYLHYVAGNFFDSEGLASKRATKHLIREIERVKPDVIHLHNIHDHYLNYPILFSYLANSGIPVVWTQHDQWATTGHCSYNSVGCERWKERCYDCPAKRKWSFDFCERNYLLKKKYFTSVKNLTVVSVSDWLNSQIKESFLGAHTLRVIKNGVDLTVFKPMNTDVRKRYGLGDKKIILGVASAWGRVKGLDDFIKLSDAIPDDWEIVLVGAISNKVERNNIVYVERTQNQLELAEFYTAANVIASLSRSETFGLTIAEAMACGTPAIVYDNTAQPELVTEVTGTVVKQGDIEGIVKVLERFNEKTLEISEKCRERAKCFFDKDKTLSDCISLYDRLLSQRCGGKM